MDAMERLVRILATTVPAFLAREKPISRNAKPACMKNTSRAASTTQVVSIAALVLSVPGCGVALATAGRASNRTPAKGSARLYMAEMLDGRRAGVFVHVEEDPGGSSSRLSTGAPAVQGRARAACPHGQPSHYRPLLAFPVWPEPEPTTSWRRSGTPTGAPWAPRT